MAKHTQNTEVRYPVWYVMQVRTGTEENIRCQCQRLISSNVLERCFIPYYQQKKRFQGEWHIQERILFPGYVFLIAVRAKPCLPLWSFSLIRKTELWKTNKPPAMQVSQHCFSLQKKTSGGIINVGSPTALIYTGGIHMDNNSLSHTKWNCKYHIVFAPKYRRKVAYGKIKQDIADILSMLCKRKGVKIVEAEICPDHVHMLVEIPPSISVSYFVGYLKGKSTLMIFERHANLKYKYGNRHFWCRGYYVDTVGKNAKKIQEYIANQLQDDLEYDQMTLKEYIDPFTGEPVKRNK